jgi:hypothetical protein
MAGTYTKPASVAFFFAYLDYFPDHIYSPFLVPGTSARQLLSNMVFSNKCPGDVPGTRILLYNIKCRPDCPDLLSGIRTPLLMVLLVYSLYHTREGFFDGIP